MIRRILAFAILAWTLALPALATVNSSSNKTIALGNGVQTVFTFPWIGVATSYITVVYTDANGNETTLSQGAGSTQYQISLNAPVQGAIWGLGGTITYNPSATPIASGTTLTIYRTLPLTQAQSLQNQSSVQVLGSGAETGLDTGVMQGQQINEAISRALQMNITNTAPPNPLPAAAQAAGMGLCFDSSGNNVIACSLAPSGTISSAMAPVVAAASLAAGRTALGLGSMALENINGGTCGGSSIQDDGSAGGANGVGYARALTTTVQDSTNQSVACSFHYTYRIASGPLTYTLPRASTTLFNGFEFTINSSVGVSTVTPNANDQFAGVASGTAIAIPQGVSCKLTTDAASSATWRLNCSSSQPSIGASSNGTALTLTLYATALPFRDPTLANGDAKWATPAGGLSITVPSGATLGTSSSNVPFKVYLFAAYNGGTPVLGVATCSSATAIYACSAWETLQNTASAITSGASSLGTLYTASNITNDAVRIIGFAEYASGLGTAGTWASTPTTLQVCIPPFVCKRPGDIVQGPYYIRTASTTSCNSTSFSVATALTGSITPTSTVNLIRIGGQVYAQTGNQASLFFQISRGSSPTLIGNIAELVSLTSGSALTGTVPVFAIDQPATVSSQGYTVYCKNGTATGTFNGGSGVSTMTIEEIMGALSPTNDNGAPLRMVG